MIPVTPGGLGLVEASLTGLLVLAEVDSSQAVLATLTYRIASYWVPLLAGPIAYGLFRLRSGKRADPVTGGEPAKGQLRSEAARSSRSSRLRRPVAMPAQPRGEIRAGVTSTATRRSSAITRS